MKRLSDLNQHPQGSVLNRRSQLTSVLVILSKEPGLADYLHHRSDHLLQQHFIQTHAAAPTVLSHFFKSCTETRLFWEMKLTKDLWLQDVSEYEHLPLNGDNCSNQVLAQNLSLRRTDPPSPRGMRKHCSSGSLDG